MKKHFRFGKLKVLKITPFCRMIDWNACVKEEDPAGELLNIDQCLMLPNYKATK